jgi:IS605 OrfB family transposase
MSKENTRTYGTRIKDATGCDKALRVFAEYFSKLGRRLFADIAASQKPNDLKSDYIARYQISARHFNSLRVLIEGKIASIKARQPEIIVEQKDRIRSLDKKISHLSKKEGKEKIVHQKKRRLHTMQDNLKNLEADRKEGIVRLCFGSRKLFRAQFDLEANGYQDHEAWKKDWKMSRSRELFFLGSKDETSGNQTCTATLEPDGSLTLRVRLPDALRKQFGKYLVIEHVTFKYGHEEILTALELKDRAITWRFLLDEIGWSVFATLDITPPPCTSNSQLGAVGLDINIDHLALVETDRFGNAIANETIPLCLKGKTSDQAKALIGDAAAQVIQYVKATQKPLVIEDLDFQKKKATLREERFSGFAHLLSSFHYSSLISHLKSNALKNGVLLKQVNPAYTSLIGRFKFASRYGLSIHHTAALVIARRFLKLSERPPSASGKIPDGKSGHVTLDLPVRNRTKHVWSFWSELGRKFSAARRAHSRTAKSRSTSTVKTACETPTSEDVGENPICESPDQLLVRRSSSLCTA